MVSSNAIAQLYQRRVLAQILITRQLKARYRGTVMGFFWFTLNPLFFAMVYAVVVTQIFGVQMPAFPVFVLSGMLAWLFFSMSINEATDSIIGNGALIQRVYLPLEIFPLVAVGANLIHYLFSLLILFLFMAIYGVHVSWNLLFFPLVLFVQTLLTFGIALIVSSLTVQFRDLTQMMPNLLLAGFFLSAILYPKTMVGENIRYVVDLNPMAHLVIAYQDIFYHGRPPSLTALGVIAGLGCALTVLGFGLLQARREFIVEEV